MVKNFITPATNYNELFIIDVGEEDFAAMSHQKPNQRFHNIIHFVVAGSGAFSSTGTTFSSKSKLKENTAFAIYQTSTVFYQSDPETPLYYFWVGFDGKESQKIMNYVGFTEENPTLYMENPQKIISAFRDLFAAWKTHDDDYLLVSKFYQLLYVLRKNNKHSSEQLLHKTDADIFQKAEEYIRQNLDGNIKVSDLTKALCIDRSYFTKIFKQRFNESPHRHILRQRIKKAELLLISTNYSITQIVDLLNFTDTYSFCKQFRTFHSHSPSEYRKLHKANLL